MRAHQHAAAVLLVCVAASCGSKSAAPREELATTAAPPEQSAPVTPPLTRPEPATPLDFTDPALELVRPLEVCSIRTSGVPSAIRVTVCNCGEPLACRVTDARVEVRQDPRATTACTDCVRTTASCAILSLLTPHRATLRINDEVDLPVDTGPAGMLLLDTCWDVP